MMCPSCRVPYTSYVEVPNIFANLGDEWEGKGWEGKGREVPNIFANLPPNEMGNAHNPFPP